MEYKDIMSDQDTINRVLDNFFNTFIKPETNRRIKTVDQIESELKAIQSCPQLIEIQERKIRERIGEVWGNERFYLWRYA